MTVLDWVFLVVIAIFALVALIKGFVNELFGKAALIAGILCAIFFYSKVALMLNDKISNMILCNICAFVLIFAAVFIVFKIVGAIIHKVFELSLLRGLDKALGAMFGIVEGFAVVCLIMFVMNLQPFVDFSAMLEQSFFYGLMNAYIPEIRAAIANV